MDKRDKKRERDRSPERSERGRRDAERRDSPVRHRDKSSRPEKGESPPRGDRERGSSPPRSNEPKQTGEDPDSANVRLSMSIEETNRERIRLGLKPLKVGPTAEEKRAEAERKQKAQEEAARQAQAAETRANLEKMRQKHQDLVAFRGGHSLGEDDGTDSLASWVSAHRSKAPAPVPEGKPQEKKEEQKADYKQEELKGLKVAHDISELGEDQGHILVLADKNVLDDSAEDTLMNVELSEQVKRQRLMDKKKKLTMGRHFNPYDEADQLLLGSAEDAPLLPKYDEEAEQKLFEERRQFRLGDAKAPMAKAAPSSIHGGRELTLDAEKQRQSDFMTIDEAAAAAAAAGIPKPKKKKKLRTRAAAESIDVASLLPDSVLRGDQAPASSPVAGAGAGAETDGDHRSRNRTEGSLTSGEAARLESLAQRQERFARAQTLAAEQAAATEALRLAKPDAAIGTSDASLVSLPTPPAPAPAAPLPAPTEDTADLRRRPKREPGVPGEDELEAAKIGPATALPRRVLSADDMDEPAATLAKTPVTVPLSGGAEDDEDQLMERVRRARRAPPSASVKSFAIEVLRVEATGETVAVRDVGGLVISANTLFTTGLGVTATESILAPAASPAASPVVVKKERPVDVEKLDEIQDSLDIKPKVAPGSMAGLLQLAKQKGLPLCCDVLYTYGWPAAAGQAEGILAHKGGAIVRRAHEKDTLLAPEDEIDPDGLTLEHRDDQGRVMSAKEAFRYQCHRFHNKFSGKNKQERHQRRYERQIKQERALAGGELATQKCLALHQARTGEAALSLG
ncbi:putative U4/U6.U5 tri-snRNP-associated protein 1 [Paratrimastix pyriformis]|uniref:U4/U6.U5 tri-snRNP-associated protein 1 n=1 Tax=Paratrimastix pyriformis TaxID=342808 RepID=A0ABQ8UGU2_9EUKA|nr:putative U4/U6.U5 tri-snRNP-associated protein 1 [Paratrimastix pyriformis]